MLKDVTFGQYISGKSVIHRMDPRCKLCLFIALIVFIFLTSSAYSLAFVILAVAGMVALSGVSAKMYLKNLKSILFIVIFTSVLNIFYVKTGTPVCELFWGIVITTDGIFRAVTMTTRLMLLITLSSMLTYTSTPTALTDGLERLLSPLRFIGLGNAVHSMSMMITIALRFIPTLLEETNKIISAQKARGADMESGGLIKRIKALLPILIPLLISAVRRASELAEAMECRCYNGGKGRVRMKQLKLSLVDYMAMLAVAVFGAAVVLMRIFL